MGCKYTGLVSVVVPGGILLLLLMTGLWHRYRDGIEESVRHVEDSSSHRTPRTVQRWLPIASASLFAGGALLAVAPWLLRNLADTGNPVYPLGWSVFGGDQWNDAMQARWVPAHAPSEHKLDNIPQHMLDVAIRNDWTSGLLFAFAVPALVFCRSMPEARIIAAMMVWSFASWWALTHRIDRFWIPAIPLLAALGAMVLQLSSSRAWKTLLITALVAGTTFNLRFAFIPRLIGFHAGLMDLPAAAEWTVRDDLRQLNEVLPAGSRVLMVGEAEVFNTQFSVVYNTVFDDNIFEQWTSGKSEDQIRQTLQEQGITHIFVNWFEILRYRSPGSYGFPDYVQPSRFRQLVETGILASPQTLSGRPWDSLSESERTEILQWDGVEFLRRNPALLDGIQIYPVVPQSEKRDR